MAPVEQPEEQSTLDEAFADTWEPITKMWVRVTSNSSVATP
jgi:hypothetical protein